MEELSSARCRLCFQKKFQLLPMFPANEPVNDELLRKIRECVSVTVVYEDDQNSMICIKCIVDVEQFYSFKERCIQNDLLFQQMRPDNCPPLMDEDEFDPTVLPEMELMEPKTSLHHTDPSPASMEAFLGSTKLFRIGYNYRVVRVNDSTKVLIFRKHRYYQPEENIEPKTWACIAKDVTGCPAKLVITSNVAFPLAICNRRVKHNHSESIVQSVGVIHYSAEEIVKVLQKYTLVVDSHQRLRLLAGGFRYRLGRPLLPNGMSLWVCERSKSSSCPATVMVMYQEEKIFVEGDHHTHSHCVEDAVPVPTNVNGALMAQKKQKEVTFQTGYNFKITDGVLLFKGNFFQPGKPNSSTASSVWNCTHDACAVKVRVRRKIATLANREHEHSPAISKKRNQLGEETLQQGVNYRLILDETGHTKLHHQKQKFLLKTLCKNGATAWACTWERLGCAVELELSSDDQVVYGCVDSDHKHRVGNALEQYFPSTATNSPVSQDAVLWSCQQYELLWNRNRKPIIRRNNYRFYARKAFKSGTVQWHCTSEVRTYCEASITIDKDGKIVSESLSHDHARLRKPRVGKSLSGQKAQKTTTSEVKRPTSTAIFDSAGPVHLVAGGFNYRRMVNVQLNCEIITYCSHKYLLDDAANTYHCILRDEPESCPSKIVLTNNGLCAEPLAPHNHSTRGIRRIAQPDRMSQVTVEGPNYELIYSMTGRNCLLMHEGYAFRMYKLLEPIQCSRWRCIQGETGCKAYLNVPLSLEKPALTNGHPHDHSLMISQIKHERDDTTVSQELCSVEVKVEEPSDHEMEPRNPFADTELTTGGRRVTNMAPLTPRMITVKREKSIDDPVNEMYGLTEFHNGHLYVRRLGEEVLDDDKTMGMVCAFHWTLNCLAGFWDSGVHNHDRFASVRTNDRFTMLKVLISRGIIAQRGQITMVQPAQSVSKYELMPSNGNLSLIIDNHRYYFYKAKNNGEWLWRCVRHRWQGCKIGVAVSHCFSKYYFQPYGTIEHEHS